MLIVYGFNVRDCPCIDHLHRVIIKMEIIARNHNTSKKVKLTSYIA